ncbi:MAG: PAS domain S-box protein [Anaerolineae bacterium]|nr:PAS domain S-box protein [Anaerolineae bacterium]
MYRRSLQIGSLPFILRFTFPIVFPLIALAISRGAWSLIAGTPFVFFFLAVIFAVRAGGFLPGVAATLWSGFLVEYFLREPFGTADINLAELIQLILFLVTSLIICWIEGSRRRNQNALELARHQLIVLLDTVTDGIAVIDKACSIQYVNRAVPKIEGLKESVPTSYAAQQSITLLTESGVPVNLEDLPPVRVLQDGKPSRSIYLAKSAAGQDERWLEIKAAPVISEAGETEISISVFRDITHTKIAERLLTESRARLRQVIDHLSIYVFVTTPDGTLIEANRAALEILGVDYTEVYGKSFVAAGWWSHSADVAVQIQEALEEAARGKEVSFDTTIWNKDNETCVVAFSVAPTYNTQGVLEFLIPTAIDITDRKRKEERLAQLSLLLDVQRQRLDRILNTIPGAIFEISGDPGGPQTIEYMSDYIENLLGYTPDELAAYENFWTHIIHPEDIDALRQEAAKLVATNAPGILHFRGLHKDGQIVHLESNVVWKWNDAGKHIGALGVLINITQRREIEEALATYAEELERSNKELEQFAYIASHDLQEPLRMVTSYLQLIEQRLGERLDSDEKEFMAYAVDGANRMKGLIQALLVYSRVGRSTQEYESVSIQKVLETVVQNLKISIEDTDADLQIGSMPEILGSENQLVQLFQNLISNALKFAGDESPRISISAEEQGSFWRFEVKDNGIGIEPEFLDRIFIIFKRLHSRDEYDGTGIGLAICRKIVESHGGKIWANSQPGEGTMFNFTLPRKSYRRLLHGSHRNLAGRRQSG